MAWCMSLKSKVSMMFYKLTMQAAQNHEEAVIGFVFLLNGAIAPGVNT